MQILILYANLPGKFFDYWIHGYESLFLLLYKKTISLVLGYMSPLRLGYLSPPRLKHVLSFRLLYFSPKLFCLLDSFTIYIRKRSIYFV